MLHLNSKNLLKDCSLAVTKNRFKVLNFFLKEAKPIDLKIINSKFKDLDRVTLFRILSIFEKNKLIHSIVLDNGKKFFALCNHKCRVADNHNHKHIHFVCNKLISNQNYINILFYKITTHFFLVYYLKFLEQRHVLLLLILPILR